MTYAYNENIPSSYQRDDSILFSACYLCGSTPKPLDEEHVIPRVIFKSIKPNNYIKLRACKICHPLKSKDDEYVSRLLQGSSFNDHANQDIGEALRGIEKGHGLGLYLDQMQRSRPVPPEGIKGRRISSGIITPPFDRVERYQTNIAKGLWTTFANNIFDWKNYEIDSLSRQIAAEPELENDDFIEAATKDARYHQEWNGVFKFSGDFKDKDVSYWIMTYYDMHIAVVAIRKITMGNIDLYETIFNS